MMKIKKEYVLAKDRMKVSVGDVIKEMCELNELNQTQLAKKSGVQESNLSLIMRGKRTLGKAVAEKLAKALDVSPAFILYAGDLPRDGVDLRSCIDVPLLENAIRIVDKNKDKAPRIQLKGMRDFLDTLTRMLISAAPRQDLAPIELVSQHAKRSQAVHGKRRR
jgi:transcriptional regulator with XRE-family HTH domain